MSYLNLRNEQGIPDQHQVYRETVSTTHYIGPSDWSMWVWDEYGGTDDGVNVLVYGGTLGSVGPCWRRSLSPVLNLQSQGSTGEHVGMVGGAGVAVDDQATFTGNIGTKAYTLNDIVKALKAVGILVK